MDTALSDLLAQRDALQHQIAAAQRETKVKALAEIRQLMSEHGLTSADLALGAHGKASSTPRAKVAAKYKDPVSGASWSGRGLKPKWLTAAINSGHSLSDFAV